MGRRGGTDGGQHQPKASATGGMHEGWDDQGPWASRVVPNRDGSSPPDLVSRRRGGDRGITGGDRNVH